MSDLYIGLMSGTSADGIDAALVDFAGSQPKLVDTYYHPYPPETKTMILDLCTEGTNEIHRLGMLDRYLGKVFAHAVQQLLKKTNISHTQIQAIGSHGQTVRHAPNFESESYSLQVGDPNTISTLTQITTVADFRRKDIALGGQGAPLVPAFHQALFADKNKARVIVNIGGIANITVLLPDHENILGYDTGPGNILLDAWINLHQQKTYDHSGEWGSNGKIHEALLQHLLADPYFQLPTPKSTGREYFNLDHLIQQMQQINAAIKPIDVQTTLTYFTAQSIINAIKNHTETAEIILCGGGAHNAFLVKAIKEYATKFDIKSSQQFGIAPDWIEAMAFAWLAKQTISQMPGNIPSVTGAQKFAILGGIFFAN